MEGQNIKPLAEPSSPKKLGGVGFYVIVMFAVLKDMLDVIENLTIILSILRTLTTFLIYIVIWCYLFFSNVGFVDKFAARKLAVLVIPFIIELIPFLNIVPATTIGLFVLRTIENRERVRKFARAL